MTRAKNIYCFKIVLYWKVQHCKTWLNPKLKKKNPQFRKILQPDLSPNHVWKNAKQNFSSHLYCEKKNTTIREYFNLHTKHFDRLITMFCKVMKFYLSAKIKILPNKKVHSAFYVTFIFRKSLPLCSEKLTLLNLEAMNQDIVNVLRQ